MQINWLVWKFSFFLSSFVLSAFPASIKTHSRQAQKPTSAATVTAANISTALNKVNKCNGDLLEVCVPVFFAGLDVYAAPEVTDFSPLTESSAAV